MVSERRELARGIEGDSVEEIDLKKICIDPRADRLIRQLGKERRKRYRGPKYLQNVLGRWIARQGKKKNKPLVEGSGTLAE